MKLRYCGNTINPRIEHFHRYILVDHMHGETHVEAVQRMRDWLRGKMIGDPQPTSTYTAEQLKKMDMVGVYCTTIDEYAQTHPELIVEYPVFIGKKITLVRPIF